MELIQLQVKKYIKHLLSSTKKEKLNHKGKELLSLHKYKEAVE